MKSTDDTLIIRESAAGGSFEQLWQQILLDKDSHREEKAGQRLQLFSLFHKNCSSTFKVLTWAEFDLFM